MALYPTPPGPVEPPVEDPNDRRPFSLPTEPPADVLRFEAEAARGAARFVHETAAAAARSEEPEPRPEDHPRYREEDARAVAALDKAAMEAAVLGAAASFDETVRMLLACEFEGPNGEEPEPSAAKDAREKEIRADLPHEVRLLFDAWRGAERSRFKLVTPPLANTAVRADVFALEVAITKAADRTHALLERLVEAQPLGVLQSIEYALIRLALAVEQRR
jgi:hypothetical protein